MRRKSVNILAYFVLAVMFCLTGCKDVKDIKVTSVEVESISARGLRSVDIFLKVGVDNPAKQVRVSEIEGSLVQSGKVIGKLAMDPFILGARTSDIYTLKANVSLAQGAGLKELMVLASPDGLNGCTVDFSAKATVGKSAKMPVKMKDIPLKELLDKFENEKN
jgi:hypothetical protein